MPYNAHDKMATSTDRFAFQLLQEARGDEVLGLEVDLARGDGRLVGRVLHVEERLDRLHLRVVRTIRHRLSFGRQSAGSHPFRVLTLLKRKQSSYNLLCFFLNILTSCSLKGVRSKVMLQFFKSTQRKLISANLHTFFVRQRRAIATDTAVVCQDLVSTCCKLRFLEAVHDN